MPLDYRDKFAPHMMILVAILWPVLLIKLEYVDKIEVLNLWYMWLVPLGFILVAVLLHYKNKKRLKLQSRQQG